MSDLQEEQNTKDSIKNLKIKIYKTHELIMQYESLKNENNILKNENQDLALKYNKSQEKTLKLDLENSSYSKKDEEQSICLHEQKNKINEQQRLIDQLTFKIEDAKKKHAEEVDKLKDDITALKLESKLRSPAKSKKVKKPLQTHQSIQTDLELNSVQITISKPETSDKNINTIASNLSSNDSFPFYCANCKMHIQPNPLDEICQKMSKCPTPVSIIADPPVSKNVSDESENISQTNVEQKKNKEINRLSKKIKILEAKQKKLEMKGTSDSPSQCGLSFNSPSLMCNFMKLMLSTQRQNANLRQANKKKAIKLNRLNKHKKKRKLLVNKWVESANEFQNKTESTEPTNTAPVNTSLNENENMTSLECLLTSSEVPEELYADNKRPIVLKTYSKNNHVMNMYSRKSSVIAHNSALEISDTSCSSNSKNKLEQSESQSNLETSIFKDDETALFASNYDNDILEGEQENIEYCNNSSLKSTEQQKINCENSKENEEEISDVILESYRKSSSDDSVKLVKRPIRNIITSGEDTEDDIKKENKIPSKRKILASKREGLKRKIRNLNKVSKTEINYSTASQATEALEGNKKVSNNKLSETNVELNITNENNASDPSKAILMPSSNKSLTMAQKKKIAALKLKQSKIGVQTTPAKRMYRKHSLNDSIKTETNENVDKVDSIIKELDQSGKERKEIKEKLKSVEKPLSSDVNLSLMKNFATETGTSKDSRLHIDYNDLNFFEENDPNLSENSEDKTIVLETKEQSQEIEKMETNEPDDKSNITKESEELLAADKCENGDAVEIKQEIREGTPEPTPLELRSRKIRTPNGKNKITVFRINQANSCLEPTTTTVSALNTYFENPKKRKCNVRNKEFMAKLEENSNIINSEMDKLDSADPWTNEIQSQVMKKIAAVEVPKTIAMCLIDYIHKKTKDIEEFEFDRSFTPPAPIMTRLEQKIVVLVLGLNKIYSDMSELMITGISYKIFRLGPPLEYSSLESLFRIMLVLIKIKKDRERLRMILCDALYCLNLRAINIIYIALTSWPECFPKHGTNNDVIVKTIVHIIMNTDANIKKPKLKLLKNLLSTYYEYRADGHITLEFRDELLNALKDNRLGIETAILMFSKKMGTDWTFVNIVRNLKFMIFKSEIPDMYKGFALLGNLLKSFPTNDPGNVVKNIIGELTDLLDSKYGSEDFQEGILSALLSLTKFQPDKISQCVLKWPSTMTLRETTLQKLSSFYNAHDLKWWRKFIATKFPAQT